MVSTRQPILWFALAVLTACILPAAFLRFQPASGPRQARVRPVRDAVDAAGILYREMPVLLVSEYDSNLHHRCGAGVYLTSQLRTARELDRIQKAKPPDSPDWHGVLYVKDCQGSTWSLAKSAMCGGQFLDYRTFIICGDPALMGTARGVLARVGGVRPLEHPDSSEHE